MSLTEEAVRHTLSHLAIGEAALQATLSDAFFEQLATGHGQVLRETGHEDLARLFTGQVRDHVLYSLGRGGQFAARLGLTAEDVDALDRCLHGNDQVLQPLFVESLRTAAPLARG